VPDPRPAPALWLVDKPAGPTSHDIVARVRRALPRRTKVGHTGTLDPFATGLLVVMVGRATRLAPYMAGLDKTYRATLRTGFTSASGDPEGPIAPGGEPVDGARVAEVLPAFVGAGTQRVPALSAVKVDGERLYRRARRGEQVTAPQRTVVIHALEMLEDHGDGRVSIEVRCGPGTYVRSLAADIGERIGCGAYCEALRRTAVGTLSVDDAVAPEEVGEAGGLDPLRGLAHLPARRLGPGEAQRLRHGVPVDARGAAGEEPVALVYEERLLGVAVPREGLLRPAVILDAA